MNTKSTFVRDFGGISNAYCIVNKNKSLRCRPFINIVPKNLSFTHEQSSKIKNARGSVTAPPFIF